MNDERMQELQYQIDAILFAAGDKIEITEIARLCNLGHNLDLVEQILQQLQQKYDQHPTLMLIRDGNAFKLRIREKYIHVVKNMVAKTELTKSVMETLAIVAYRAPVLQSAIIHIRTNKAYDHLIELENAGYVTRIKKGRTKLIKLTDKFFQYFDIPPDQLKERFKNVAELEKSVEEKEQEVHTLTEERRLEKEIKKKEEQVYKQQIHEEHQVLTGHIAEKEKKIQLETYDIPPHTEIIEEQEPFAETQFEIIEEKLGPLEVYEEEQEESAQTELSQQAVSSSEPVPELEPEEDTSFDLLKENEEGEEKIQEKKSLQEKTIDDDQTSQESQSVKKDYSDDEEESDSSPQKEQAFTGEGLFTKNAPVDFEKKVNKRVEEIIHPEQPPSEENKEEEKP